MHSANTKAVYDFDEEQELRLQQTKSSASAVQHIGRGGAGNWVSTKEGEGREESFSSEKSEGRRSGGFLRRLSETFERR